MTHTRGPGGLSFIRTPDATLVVEVAGTWRLEDGIPPLAAVQRELSLAPPPRAVRLEAKLEAWDSGVLTFLAQVLELCHARGIGADRDRLPQGIRRLLALAEAVPGEK